MDVSDGCDDALTRLASWLVRRQTKRVWLTVCLFVASASLVTSGCTPGPTERLDPSGGSQISNEFNGRPSSGSTPGGGSDASTSPDPSNPARDTGPSAGDDTDSPVDPEPDTSESEDTEPTTGPTVKLATWNIRKPSEESTRTDYIATMAEKLDADVVALQELGSTPPLDEIFPSNSYQRFVSERNAEGGSNQFFLQTGFAIAEAWNVDRNADYEELAVSSGQRRGIDVTLQFENHSLRMLSVHLNASCQNGGGGEDCRILNRQARRIRDWIQARESNDEDYVVLGDFNRVYDAGSEFWETIENADDSGVIIKSKNKSPRCLGDAFDKFIDHVVFDADVQSWLQISELQDLTYEETLDINVDDIDDPDMSPVSDHCPAYVEIAEKQ